MAPWLIYALLALVTWGFWGLFPKLSVASAEPSAVLFYEAIGSVVCAVILTIYYGGIPTTNFRGAFFGVLTGVVAILGAWFYLNAARDANISIVVVITALYPVITILLAVIFLNESFGIRQVLALILSLSAILLLATEEGATNLQDNPPRITDTPQE